jgi:hypothetical protein
LKQSNEIDRGGLIAAVAMLAVAAWVLWESEGFTELAAAFPRTVALVLAGASAVLIVRCLLRRQRPTGEAGGSQLRRGALLVVLAGWVAMIPVAGFFAASVAGFLASGLIARYERWPARRWIVFLALALLAVALFYGLFSNVLLVPFPRGLLL